MGSGVCVGDSGVGFFGFLAFCWCRLCGLGNLWDVYLFSFPLYCFFEDYLFVVRVCFIW